MIPKTASETKLTATRQGEASGRSPEILRGGQAAVSMVTLWPRDSSCRTRYRRASLGVVTAVEEVGAEVFVVAFVVEHVPDDDEHGVRHRERGLALALLAEAAPELAVEGTEVAVGPRDGPGGLT